MAAARYVVEIQGSGVLLGGGIEMHLEAAEAMAGANTRRHAGRVVRVLVATTGRVSSVWRGGEKIS